LGGDIIPDSRATSLGIITERFEALSLEKEYALNQPFRVNVAAAEILSAGAAISLSARGWNPRLRIQSDSIASHREKAIRSPFLA